MPVYYLDTSALLKRYRTEQGTATINELVDGKRADEAILTSYLGALEIEAVAARLLRGGILRRGAYQRLLGQFADDLANVLTLSPLGSEALGEAMPLIRRYALRAPDAIHLATASIVRTTGGIRTIYTASDHDLLDAARREGFDVLNPEDVTASEALRQYRATV